MRKIYLIKLNVWYLKLDKKIKPLGWGWREKEKGTPLDIKSAESWMSTLERYYGKGICKLVMDSKLKTK